MYDFLSGKVPGGFALYVLVILLIFLVLYNSSRKNDLFTPAKFKVWFLAVWAVITLGYFALWVSDPPPEVLNRYSVFFVSEDPAAEWVAEALNQETEAGIQPFRSPTDFFFPMRWTQYGGVSGSGNNSQVRDRIVRNLPIDQFVLGALRKSANGHILQMTLYQSGGEVEKTSPEFRLEADNPFAVATEIAAWISEHLQVKLDFMYQMPPDSLSVHAKAAFYAKKYKKSENLCVSTLMQHPNHAEIQRWQQFNRIRLAGIKRTEEKDRNPYETRKSEWELMLMEARKILINRAKENIAANIDDPVLDNMIAESFIQEERFAEAEEFLKIAYNANPFNIEVLENLSLLHPSRYEDLSFSNKRAILNRILEICPMYESVLVRLVEDLLQSVPVNQAPSQKVREYLDRMLALNPNSTTALMLQGKYLLTIFDYRQAYQMFLKADSLAPESELAKYNLGVTAFKLEEFSAARGYFQEAIRIADHLDSHLYLGVIYQQDGNFEEALERFRYRVANQIDEDDYYAVQAMKGIRECLKELNIPIPE